MRRKDTFGVDLRQFCKAHEAAVQSALEAGTVTPLLLERHRERLRWLQHERLIHLIVLSLTALAELFTVDLALLHPETHPGAAVVMLALAVLLGFYFAYYFFLENTTQHWYTLTEELEQRLQT